MVSVNVLVEGITDEAVAVRLLEYAELDLGTVYGKSGKPDLLKKLSNYNKAAKHVPWFVIVDLDQNAKCASEAIQKWLPVPEKGLHLRVAVRAIEAWLIADTEKLAEFLGISRSIIPQLPDNELNPKQTLVNLARRSRKKGVRDDIVPRQDSGATVGAGYSGRLIEFTTNFWRPEEAEKRSDSLHRCLKALVKLKSEW